MIKAIFLVGYFCVNSVCVCVNEKTDSVDVCKILGNDLKLILDEQNINKYFFACVDATEYRQLNG